MKKSEKARSIITLFPLNFLKDFLRDGGNIIFGQSFKNWFEPSCIIFVLISTFKRL